jgi:hypothetical protein
VKARIVDKKHVNSYKKTTENDKINRSQYELMNRYKL